MKWLQSFLIDGFVMVPTLILTDQLGWPTWARIVTGASLCTGIQLRARFEARERERGES